MSHRLRSKSSGRGCVASIALFEDPEVSRRVASGEDLLFRMIASNEQPNRNRATLIVATAVTKSSQNLL